ncbi:MAG TPA: hypothetical protein ENJ56_08110 [Anaerolineae bacterium]|nr:hypothetical protein [Anaerolineae bacterium]
MPIIEFENSEFIGWVADSDKMLIRVWNGLKHVGVEEDEDEPDGVMLWDVATGEVTVLFELEPTIRLNGKDLLAYREEDSAEITIIDPFTKIARYTILTEPYSNFYWLSDTQLLYWQEKQPIIFDVIEQSHTPLTIMGGDRLQAIELSPTGNYLSAIYCPEDWNSCQQTYILSLQNK